MSITRIAYRIISNGKVLGVTTSRDKAVEYWRDGCEVYTRIRYYWDERHWQYELRDWKLRR